MNVALAQTRASDTILARKNELAREITDALYADDPALLERFGEAGRAKCLQDMEYCLEHLAPAVAMDEPSLFVRHVTWLEGLLAARGIVSGDVRRSLEATRAVLAQRLRPEESASALRCLHAAQTSLSDAPAVIAAVEVGAPVEWWRVYLAALRAGDRRGALVVVEDARAAGLGLPALYLDVFQPALREIGRLWQENEITVAEEHLATAITQMSMGRLYTDFCLSTSRNGRTLLAACAETEKHEIGLRMICDLLELDGWDATYLGTAVPTDSLVAMVLRDRPDVLALSASIAPHLPQLRTLIAAVRAATGQAAPYILVGGRPFLDDPTLAQRVDADAMAHDPAAAAELLRERFG